MSSRVQAQPPLPSFIVGPPRHRLRFWKPISSERDMDFAEVVRGLMAGDFSRLAPLFEAPPDRSPAPIVSWHERGLFTDEPKALDEAFSCACFNGCTQVVEYFLSKGAHPSAGANTGLNA